MPRISPLSCFTLCVFIMQFTTLALPLLLFDGQSIATLGDFERVPQPFDIKLDVDEWLHFSKRVCLTNWERGYQTGFFLFSSVLGIFLARPLLQLHRHPYYILFLQARMSFKNCTQGTQKRKCAKKKRFLVI
jgi:hypothetical protein